MPTLRPFRALRYDPTAIADVAAVISPPYDVISPAQQATLAARHPRNSVLLDLPPDQPGDEPGARYRRAAAALAAWRSDGTLRKDPAPAIYAYEQAYDVPGTTVERTQRGFFARLALESFGPGSGVLPHERTLGGPKEDRHALLKATGANFSPIVGLYESPSGESGQLLASVAVEPPATAATDDDGVRHRLWVVPVGRRGDGSPGARLIELAEAGPITIADGHHRYETALRYRDERAANRACTIDPPYEFILALVFDLATTEMTILPTHRVVRGGPPEGELPAALERLFRVEPLPSAETLVAAFPPTGGGGNGPRIGSWAGGRAAVLRPRTEALAPLLPGDASPVLRGLGVTVLEAAFSAIHGLDRAAIAAGERIDYVRDAVAAIAAVDRGEGDAAYLLEPTDAADVVRVARAGELMPQKSTYFYPKPATGLLFSPGEW